MTLLQKVTRILYIYITRSIDHIGPRFKTMLIQPSLVDVMG